MAKYQIWNGRDTIYTPGGPYYTTQQWREKFAWLNVPGAKMIISGGVINGGCALEFHSYVESAKRAGCEILPSMTDGEVLAAIEAFEDAPPVVDDTPTAEERTAAALEFLAISSLPDEN